MLIVGLTGGMGSGKTEVARRLRERGIPVIDADAVGHRVIAPGGIAETEVKQAFGPLILSDGTIDRRKLGRLVFSDLERRRTLNAIVHPKITEEILAECANLEAAGHRIVVVEAALWGEDGTLPPWMDTLVLVESPEVERIDRVMRTRGMSREGAMRRIAAQVSPEEKLDIVDYVIQNTEDLPALYAAVDRFAELLHARSHRA